MTSLRAEHFVCLSHCCLVCSVDTEGLEQGLAHSFEGMNLLMKMLLPILCPSEAQQSLLLVSGAEHGRGQGQSLMLLELFENGCSLAWSM